MKKASRWELPETLMLAKEELALKLRPYGALDDALGRWVSDALARRVGMDISGHRIEGLTDIVRLVEDIHRLALQRLKRLPPPDFDPDMFSDDGDLDEQVRALTTPLFTPSEQEKARKLRNARIAHLLALTGMTQKEFSRKYIELARVQNPGRRRTATGRSTVGDEDEWEDARFLFEMYVAGESEQQIGKRMWLRKNRRKVAPGAVLREPTESQANTERAKIDDAVDYVLVILRNIPAILLILNIVGLAVARTAVAACWKKQQWYALKVGVASHPQLVLAGTSSNALWVVDAYVERNRIESKNNWN